MRYLLPALLIGATSATLMTLTACGGGDSQTATVTIAPAEVIVIASVEQFDAEIAKPRPGAVVVADFHAEWCGPCKKLTPELNALAAANPGKLYVLKVDIDQQPKLAERFQVESIPLLVKFADGKPGERQVGFIGGERLARWLGVN
jgi:thioredoxin